MRNMKKKIAALIAACFVVGLIPAAMTFAGGNIEVDRKCNITVQTPEAFEELKEVDFEVELFRIASVDSNCVFTALEGYELIAEDLNGISSDTTAEDWSAIAEKVGQVISTATKNSDAVIKMCKGCGTATNMDTGLYYVYAKEVKSDCHGYTFTPYILAAPSNIDSWEYDNIVVSLKAEEYELEGDLEIIKSLKTYNTALGTPLFVFDVEAVDKDGKVVLSDVVSISFDAAGRRKAVVKGIPAGSTVTITEVYSGASYKVVSNPSETTTIIAEDIVSVEFVNDYTDELKYGTGVVNHFEYDGQGWEWHPIEDNQ